MLLFDKSSKMFVLSFVKLVTFLHKLLLNRLQKFLLFFALFLSVSLSAFCRLYLIVVHKNDPCEVEGKSDDEKAFEYEEQKDGHSQVRIK
jgi:hypothetical protein